MFAKNPVKRFVVVLSVLGLVALGSLLAQLAETNRNYENSQAHVQYLQSRLGEAHERVVQLNEEKLARQEQAERQDLLEFKSATFHKKFPEFSHIVDVAFRKARRYGFNPNLVLSIIQVESAFNPLAVSPAGACGLMQVRYSVWKDELGIDKSRLFDVDYNIDLGLRILKQYHDLSGGNIQRALFLYNNGYLYHNTGYLARVNSSIFNQEPREASPTGVSN
ncbi:MAG: lytic transglycosylase domain-containing protein [Acidobacteria bacterium]|jgi:soluble lytic murein transglycosylase-like protein|nr:lytic transglycosylase domain-containing protein [Acidobacteriota bacterium]